MCCETSWDIKIKKWWCVTIFNHFKGSRTWQEALSTQWIGAAERLKWFFLCDDRSNRISFFGRWLFKSHFFFFAVVVHIIFFAMIVQIAFLSGDYRLHCCNFLRWLFTSFFCDHCPDRIFWRCWFIFFFCEERPNPVFAHYFWQSSATSISQRISASRNLHFRTSVFNCAIAKKKAIYFFLFFFFDFSSHSIFCIFFGGCAYQT